jgi:hypothetical protein
VQLPPFSRLFLHFGGRLAPAFPAFCQNALLFFVWLWYIGLGIVKAALKSSVFLFFLEQLCYFNLSPQGDGNLLDQFVASFVLLISTYPRKGTETGRDANRPQAVRGFQLIPAKPSQALRASSPEGRAFVAATYLVLSSPFRGSWHGVSRD